MLTNRVYVRCIVWVVERYSKESGIRWPCLTTKLNVYWMIIFLRSSQNKIRLKQSKTFLFISIVFSFHKSQLKMKTDVSELLHTEMSMTSNGNKRSETLNDILVFAKQKWIDMPSFEEKQFERAPEKSNF